MNEGYKLDLLTPFEIVYCCKCGIPFAVPSRIRDRWLKHGTSFYCPAGHGQHYAESEVQKLQKQLANAQKRTEWAEQAARNARIDARHAESRRRAEKAAKTRLKNRVSKGVCPCCNRHFANLHQHMATKHPDFVQSED